MLLSFSLFTIWKYTIYVYLSARVIESGAFSPRRTAGNRFILGSFNVSHMAAKRQICCTATRRSSLCSSYPGLALAIPSSHILNDDSQQGTRHWCSTLIQVQRENSPPFTCASFFLIWCQSDFLLYFAFRAVVLRPQHPYLAACPFLSLQNSYTWPKFRKR